MAMEKRISIGAETRMAQKIKGTLKKLNVINFIETNYIKTFQIRRNIWH